MKQKNIINISISAIILFFAQCTKPLSIEVPQSPPKLCISSQVVPGNTVLVSVTKSFTSLYDNTKDTSKFGFDIFIAHALVTIKYDGQVDTLFKLTDGVYTALNINLSANNTYELYVYDSTSKEVVTAVTTMQPAINLDSISKKTFIENNPVTGKMDTSVGLSFSLSDNPNTEDFYLLSFTKTSQNSSAIPIPGALANSLNSGSSFYLYTDDDVEEGKINKEIKQGVEFPFSKNDTLLTLASRIDRSYYTYLAALKRKGNLLNQITGEPINVKGNIKNGYGYFSAVIPAIRIIDMTK
jgi:Domain of unknown function (DUF4249)